MTSRISGQEPRRCGVRSKKWVTLVAAIGSASMFLTACAGDGNGEGTAGANGAGESCDIAADYPSGPIEMIVPFAAGGGTDSVARLVASQLSDRLGERINVVNRAGGGAVVGHNAIAGATSDGQTLGLVVNEVVTQHHMGLTELTPEDFTAISVVNENPAGLTVSADSQWETAEDLLTYIEQNPGEVRASGTGQGGVWHMALVGMLLEAGLDVDSVIWVPSEGAAPALQQLVAGGVDLSTASLGENQAMLGEQARALAVMGAEPDPSFPDVPTLGESAGVEYEMGVWRGIVGPAGIEEDVVAELDCHLEEVVASEEYQEAMANSSLGPVYRNTEDFNQFLDEQDAAMGELVEAAGLGQ